MEYAERKGAPIRIDIRLSPQEADLAIVSIDPGGKLGNLNRMVMETYGFSTRDVPSVDALSGGTALLSSKGGKKEILFIVIYRTGSIAEDLRMNFRQAIKRYYNSFIDRKIWIPLVGTGPGELSLRESYDLILEMINEISAYGGNSMEFLISLPSTEDGLSFYHELSKEGQDQVTGHENNAPGNSSSAFESSSQPDPIPESAMKTTGDQKEPEEVIVQSHQIAGLLSDTDKGADYLNITQDVAAFARVLAAKSFKPPLAVALLGKWGSGKSFFMRKLQEFISELSTNSNDEAYCKGIAHVSFNAWSYMDANLWASIVSKIFEGLNEYISDNTAPGVEKSAVEQQLSKELNMTKEEMNSLEKSKKVINEQINKLKGKRKEANRQLINSIHKIRVHSMSSTIKQLNEKYNVGNKMREASDRNPSLKGMFDEFEKIVPAEYWSDPEKSYEVFKSRYTFLKEFFNGKKVVWNIVALLIILGLIAWVPFLLKFASFQIERTQFVIPQAVLSIIATIGVLWKRAEKAYHDVKGILAELWSIKNKYDTELQAAIEKFEQEEKALTLEAEKFRTEMMNIDTQIMKAEQVRNDLEFKIKHALATESLYTFIDKRSHSDDYKKHLGIISIIRKDFEILNGLFIGHAEELNALKGKEVEVFRSKFKKRLERIILYIDDLDRCSEENVVQVLEAVNLLMAFPLFIVVVGVDSRWVKNALIKKHALQFTRDGEVESGFERIDPANYLEKIFQVPFHLKQADSDDVKEMIKSLANLETGDESAGDNIQQGLGPNGDKDTLNSPGGEITLNYIPDQGTPGQEVEFIVEERTELLVLSPGEIELMEEMSVIIGNNPRAIKRFVNIFRIVKAHGEQLNSGENAREELLVVLFLLALPLGQYRKLQRSIDEFLTSNEMNLSSLPFSGYFNQLNNQNYPVRDQSFDDLQQDLLNVLLASKTLQEIQNIPLSEFLKYREFVKRFTFDVL
ncbi:P-loop NTPase fold protein [Chitinophaga caeni]|nr:P-loop NTPase fold protein [Chitinophaga caeni]